MIGNKSTGIGIIKGESKNTAQSIGLNASKMYVVKQMINGIVTDTSDVEPSVSFQHNGANITHIVFDTDTSRYLKDYATDQNERSYVLKINNKTKQKDWLINISNFAYTDGTNTYYKANIKDTIPLATFDVLDELFIDIDLTNESTVRTENVSGAVTLDLAVNDTFVLTMTGATNFTFTNLPPNTNASKRAFTIWLTGEHSYTRTGANIIDIEDEADYNGSVWNIITFEVLSNTSGAEIIRGQLIPRST
jgi:hypothetical protein